MEKSNCGAWCTKCGKQDVRYTITNGSFYYTCLTAKCGNEGNGWGDKFLGNKPRRVIKYVR